MDILYCLSHDDTDDVSDDYFFWQQEKKKVKLLTYSIEYYHNYSPKLHDQDFTYINNKVHKMYFYHVFKN